MESTIFASVVTKLDPTQFRGPNPKGMNAAGFWFVASEIPSLNLSGMKSSTSSPHISASWCRA
ncbi:hypothetical protein LINGRAHAP2_LOCUS35695, partial [Linum grandiflorum]